MDVAHEVKHNPYVKLTGLLGSKGFLKPPDSTKIDPASPKSYRETVFASDIQVYDSLPPKVTFHNPLRALQASDCREDVRRSGPFNLQEEGNPSVWAGSTDGDDGGEGCQPVEEIRDEYRSSFRPHIPEDLFKPQGSSSFDTEGRGWRPRKLTDFEKEEKEREEQGLGGTQKKEATVAIYGVSSSGVDTATFIRGWRPWVYLILPDSYDQKKHGPHLQASLESCLLRVVTYEDDIDENGMPRREFKPLAPGELTIDEVEELPPLCGTRLTKEFLRKRHKSIRVTFATAKLRQTFISRMRFKMNMEEKFRVFPKEDTQKPLKERRVILEWNLQLAYHRVSEVTQFRIDAGLQTHKNWFDVAGAEEVSVLPWADSLVKDPGSSMKQVAQARTSCKVEVVAQFYALCAPTFAGGSPPVVPAIRTGSWDSELHSFSHQFPDIARGDIMSFISFSCQVLKSNAERRTTEDEIRGQWHELCRRKPELRPRPETTHQDQCLTLFMDDSLDMDLSEAGAAEEVTSSPFQPPDLQEAYETGELEAQFRALPGQAKTTAWFSDKKNGVAEKVRMDVHETVVVVLAVGRVSPDWERQHPNTVMLCYDSPEEMLEGFSILIQLMNPDIVTGWNTYGFDNEKLWQSYKSAYLPSFQRLTEDITQGFCHAAYKILRRQDAEKAETLFRHCGPEESLLHLLTRLVQRNVREAGSWLRGLPDQVAGLILKALNPHVSVRHREALYCLLTSKKDRKLGGQPMRASLALEIVQKQDSAPVGSQVASPHEFMELQEGLASVLRKELRVLLAGHERPGVKINTITTRVTGEQVLVALRDMDGTSSQVEGGENGAECAESLFLEHKEEEGALNTKKRRLCERQKRNVLKGRQWVPPRCGELEGRVWESWEAHMQKYDEKAAGIGRKFREGVSRTLRLPTKTSVPSALFSSRLLSRISKNVVKAMESGAKGSNIYNMWHMEGRIGLDMMQYIKDGIVKLESYSLNNVMSVFCNWSKTDMPIKRMFALYSEGGEDNMGLIADYVERDSLGPLAIFLARKVAPDIVEMSNVSNTNIDELFNRGQQIKVVNLLATYCKTEGFLFTEGASQYPGHKVNLDEVPFYNKAQKRKNYGGAKVVDPIPGFHTKPVSTLDFASLYPSIMLAFNLCFSTILHPEDRALLEVAIKDRKSALWIWAEERNDAAADESMDGEDVDSVAAKHDAKKRGREELGQNDLDEEAREAKRRKEGMELLVWNREKQEYRVKRKKADRPIIEDVTVDINVLEDVNRKTGDLRYSALSKTFSFMQHLRGVLKGALELLLGQRKLAKKDMAAEEKKVERGEGDPMMVDIQNSRQLALKVFANSIYGFTGAGTNFLCHKEVAAAVTARGRMLLELTQQLMEEKYNLPGQEREVDIIYGDTDSIMVRWNKYEGRRAAAMKMADGAEAYLNDFYLSKGWDTIEMENEKTYDPYLLIGKKCYAGRMYTKDPNKHDKDDAKGLAQVRRDKAKFSKRVSKEFVRVLMEDKDVVKAFSGLVTEVNNLLQKRVPLYELIMSKTTKASYSANSTPPESVQVRNREIERGHEVGPIGDRVEYVILDRAAEEYEHILKLRQASTSSSSSSTTPVEEGDSESSDLGPKKRRHTDSPPPVSEDAMEAGRGEGDVESEEEDATVKEARRVAWEQTQTASFPPPHLSSWKKYSTSKCAEDPGHVLKHGLRIGYMYYLNRLHDVMKILVEPMKDRFPLFEVLFYVAAKRVNAGFQLERTGGGLADAMAFAEADEEEYEGIKVDMNHSAVTQVDDITTEELQNTARLMGVIPIGAVFPEEEGSDGRLVMASKEDGWWSDVFKAMEEEGSTDRDLTLIKMVDEDGNAYAEDVSGLDGMYKAMLFMSDSAPRDSEEDEEDDGDEEDENIFLKSLAKEGTSMVDDSTGSEQLCGKNLVPSLRKMMEPKEKVKKHGHRKRRPEGALAMFLNDSDEEDEGSFPDFSFASRM